VLHEKGTATMKLTTNTQVSVDGVMQADCGRSEDLDPGMERGGWARPLFGNEAMTLVNETYPSADALLFGRRTYELFAGYWGMRKDLEDPIVGALNTKPKYVASNTLTDPQWRDTTVLSGDLAAAIGELKAKRGGELQVHGSGAVTRCRWAGRPGALSPFGMARESTRSSAMSGPVSGGRSMQRDIGAKSVRVEHAWVRRQRRALGAPATRSAGTSS
jgi:dihydrofolate reductase